MICISNKGACSEEGILSVLKSVTTAPLAIRSAHSFLASVATTVLYDFIPLARNVTRLRKRLITTFMPLMSSPSAINASGRSQQWWRSW